MSDPAALIAVPFYAPVRTDAGPAGPFFGMTPGENRLVRLDRGARPAAPEAGGMLVYDQQGRWVGDRLAGRLVNIWI